MIPCISHGANQSATNARVEHFRNPETGPNGEPLFTDVTVLGPIDAERVLLLSSGTHSLRSDQVSKTFTKTGTCARFAARNPGVCLHEGPVTAAWRGGR